MSILKITVARKFDDRPQLERIQIRIDTFDDSLGANASMVSCTCNRLVTIRAAKKNNQCQLNSCKGTTCDMKERSGGKIRQEVKTYISSQKLPS